MKNIAGLTSAARALRDSLFSGVDIGLRDADDRRAGGSRQGANASPTVTADGTATWTIPLQISVRLGGLSQRRLASRPIRRPGCRSRRRPVPAPPIAPGLDEALEEARVARSRTYYDSAADLAAARGLLRRHRSAGGRRDAVPPTERTPLDHPHTTPGIPALPSRIPVRRSPSRLKIRSIYSQRTFEAEELIREDFRIAQERAVRLQERLATEGTLSRDALLPRRISSRLPCPSTVSTSCRSPGSARRSR